MKGNVPSHTHTHSFTHCRYQISIENNNDLATPLLLFVNPLELDAPDPNANGVTLLQAGNHSGETMSGVV